MSAEDVELIRRCVEAINQGGLDAAVGVVDELCHPDLELRAVGRLPDLPELLRGREAIKAYFAQLFGTFDYRLAVDEFIDAGDAVVVVARQVGDDPDALLPVVRTRNAGIGSEDSCSPWLSGGVLRRSDRRAPRRP